MSPNIGVYFDITINLSHVYKTIICRVAGCLLEGVVWIGPAENHDVWESMACAD